MEDMKGKKMVVEALVRLSGKLPVWLLKMTNTSIKLFSFSVLVLSGNLSRDRFFICQWEASENISNR